MSRYVGPILLLAMLTASTASVAQQLPTPPAQPASATPYWPEDLATIGEGVDLVTLSAPTQRHHCTVASFSSAQITCERPFHRAPSIYKPQDILAIISPGHHDNPRLDFAFCEGIAGGVITGAVFLGLVVSMPLGLFLAIPVGLIGVSFGGLCGMIFDDGSESSYIAPRVLYLRPGQQLHIPLK